VPEFVSSLRASNHTDVGRLAFEFLILTAVRTREVLGAKWSEIDLAQRVWTVPAERMKVGRPHRVPLSERAVEILTRAKEIGGAATTCFRGVAAPSRSPIWSS
jgi:integrase